MQVAYARGVKISSLRHLGRKANLELLIEEFGGATALAKLVGTPKTHISAMISGDRGMGDQLAAKFEKKCGKPAGWMDDGHFDATPDEQRGGHPSAISHVAPEEVATLLAAFGKLPRTERDELVKMLTARAATIDEMVERYLVERGASPSAPAANLPVRGMSVFGELDELPPAAPAKKTSGGTL